MKRNLSKTLESFTKHVAFVKQTEMMTRRMNANGLLHAQINYCAIPLYYEIVDINYVLLGWRRCLLKIHLANL